MSLGIRRNIAKKIAELIAVESESKASVTKHLLRSFELKVSKKDKNDIELHLPVIKMRNLLENNNVATIINKIISTNYNNEKNDNDIRQHHHHDHDQFIKTVAILNNGENLSQSYLHSTRSEGSSSNDTKIVFKLNRNTFIQETLNECNKDPRNGIEDGTRNCNQNFVIEFSSPNIAKPFHVGHLRSTIIGNFIANLQKYLGNNVIKMNYLGDWGTQFGYLQIGVELLNLNDDEMKKNPIQNLYNAYVYANKLAKENSNIADEARRIFTQLENDLISSLSSEINEKNKKWKKYREYTIDELKIIYQRLGVEFDVYAWESQYNQNQIRSVIEILEGKGLLLNEIDGRKIAQVGDRRVPVIKSDGSTLYLARDIAAILDRYDKYKFDKLIYVVDNAQTDHFNALFHIIENLDGNLKNRLQHIKFGRIKGMSTRSGTVIFLKDVLDEARNIMKQKQIQSPTTKVDINLDDRIADILGISAVIVNDLKQRRQRDYDFSWDKALQVNGDTGIKLQYTHCRLCSLSENVNVIPVVKSIPELLQEPEAIQLIAEISKFSEILYRSEENLEPCVLVNYLFSLSNSISRALKTLNVKNEPSREIQSQRMLMFETSKKVLYDGMKILGLQPLTKM